MKDNFDVGIPGAAQQINQFTYHRNEYLWMNNLARNIETIRLGTDIKDLPKQKNKPAIVIAAGPTVKKYKQLKKIAKSDFKGHIFVCDKSLRDALKHKLDPLYVVAIDGNPCIADFFREAENNGFTQAIFNAITISPTTIKECNFPIHWFISMLDHPREPKSLTRAIHYMTKKTMLASMGNVGGTAWHLAYYLGYNPIALVGLDYGYPQPTHIEDTIYYDAYLKLVGGEKELVKNLFKVIKNKETGKEMLIDMNFNAYRGILLPFLKAARCTTINCSPESTIFGDGIHYQLLEEFLDEQS